jgi:hypothetical protein
MRIEQSAAVSAASSGEPAQQAFGLVDGDTRIAVPRWRLSAGYESDQLTAGAGAAWAQDDRCTGRRLMAAPAIYACVPGDRKPLA